MKKNLLILSALLALFACQKEPAQIKSPKEISFKSSIYGASKVLDNQFEDGDVISVAAFEDGAQLDATTYIYNGSCFESVTPFTKTAEDQALSFSAIYPKLEAGYLNEFTFKIADDQSQEEAFETSDLLAAKTEPTAATQPMLTFNHKLSLLYLSFEDLDGNPLSPSAVTLTAIGSVDCNVEEDSYVASQIAPSAIIPTEDRKAILAPQAIAKDSPFASLIVDGKSYSAAFANDAVMESGFRYTAKFSIDLAGGLVYIELMEATIDEWNDGGELPVGNNVAFEDPLLKTYLLDATKPHIPQQIDEDGDGEISKEEAAKVIKINISNGMFPADEDRVSSLGGLENFTSLDTLICDGNNLVDVDYSLVPNIRTLYAQNNKTENIDLSKNTKLETLYCGMNELKSVDVSSCTELKLLSVSGSILESLDVKMLTKLEDLYITGNKFTKIDVSGMESLKVITAYWLPEILSMDMSNCPNLEEIDFSGNPKLASVDMSGCPELKRLNCGGCTALGDIDFTGLSSLEELDCESYGSTGLDISDCVNLKLFSCSWSDKLTALDLTKNVNLLSIDCSGCQITELDLSNCPNLAKEDNMVGDQMDLDWNYIDINVKMTQAQFDLPILNEWGNTQVIVEIVD